MIGVYASAPDTRPSSNLPWHQLVHQALLIRLLNREVALPAGSSRTQDGQTDGRTDRAQRSRARQQAGRTCMRDSQHTAAHSGLPD